MSLRLHVPGPLSPDQLLELPEGAARHAQVRRVQPGDLLRVFDGEGHEFQAQVHSMGRRDVVVRLVSALAVDAELRPTITLALGMPANERMDTLVEKATELGAAAFQPLECERSVLRLAGDRASKKVVHWQGVAVAAAEQCGRAVVPPVAPVRSLPAWLASLPPAEAPRWLLSFGDDARSVPLRAAELPVPPPRLTVLSGPEGGLSLAEEALALAHGFVRVSLGPRVLRADTAPLAILSWWTLQGETAW